MAKRAGTIIAETLGIDAAEIASYRYQSTQTSQPVYAIGDSYYAVSASVPKVTEFEWKPLEDQFWATRSQTVIWQAKGEA